MLSLCSTIMRRVRVCVQPKWSVSSSTDWWTPDNNGFDYRFSICRAKSLCWSRVAASDMFSFYILYIFLCCLKKKLWILNPQFSLTHRKWRTDWSSPGNIDTTRVLFTVWQRNVSRRSPDKPFSPRRTVKIRSELNVKLGADRSEA